MDLHFADSITSVWDVIRVNERISTFVQDAWWPNWSYWAVLSEQTQGYARHFCTVHAYGSNQQASDFLLEGSIYKPFPLPHLGLQALDQSCEGGEMQ